MARLSVKDGKAVWRTDNMDVPKPMLIDPNKSPKEEIWRYCYICSHVWLNKYKVWSEAKEPIEQLEQDCLMATYLELRRRVRLGKYNRKYTFYLNVRSCAFSKVGQIVAAWIEEQRQINDLVDVDANIGYDDYNKPIALVERLDHAPTWLTDYDTNKQFQTRDWQEYCLPYQRCKALERELNDAYEAYMTDCSDFGITGIVPREAWLRRHFQTELDLVLHPEGMAFKDGHERVSTSDYTRSYYVRNRERILENARRRKMAPTRPQGRPKKQTKTEAERFKQLQMHEYYLQRKAKKEGP